MIQNKYTRTDISKILEKPETDKEVAQVESELKRLDELLSAYNSIKDVVITVSGEEFPIVKQFNSATNISYYLECTQYFQGWGGGGGIMHRSPRIDDRTMRFLEDVRDNAPNHIRPDFPRYVDTRDYKQNSASFDISDGVNPKQYIDAIRSFTTILERH